MLLKNKKKATVIKIKVNITYEENILLVISGIFCDYAKIVTVHKIVMKLVCHFIPQKILV